MISNLTTTRITGGIRLNWSAVGSHETEIYISVNGASFSLLTTLGSNVTTYDDINDYVAKTVKYRVREKYAVKTSSFSNTVNDILEFVFTSTGNGSGLGVFNLEVSKNTVMTIDGTGRFYTDINGTTGESTSFELTTTGSGYSGNLNRIYIKVPSGKATVRVKNVVTKWGEPVGGGNVLNDGWDTYCYGDHSSLNCPSVSINVAKMAYNTSLNIFGLNTLYGDLSGNTIMTYMEIADGTPRHTTPGGGGATICGDISLMPLDTFDCWDDTHFTGTCSSPYMKIIWCNGLNEVTFNISAMPQLRTLIVLEQNYCSVIGNISLCPNLIFVQVMRSNTITGSISGLTDLEYILVYGLGNTISVPNLTNVRKLGYLRIEGLVLSSANINQILADLWANRDVARTYTYRIVRLNNPGSGSPTGQGLIDLANLRAYRSPNNDPQYALWDIAVIT